MLGCSSVHDVGPALRTYMLYPLEDSFSIPRLQEKPQNPIIDGLRHASHSPSTLQRDKKDGPDIGTNNVAPVSTIKSQIPDLDWGTLYKLDRAPENLVKSWDSLQSNISREPKKSSFLSEQSYYTMTATRYSVHPTFEEADTFVTHLSELELLSSLLFVVLGTSSSTHHWDDHTERFVLAGVTKNRHGKLVLHNKDSTMTEGLIDRFINIGTTFRRLDKFVQEVQESIRTGRATTYAFLHALSEVLAYLRSRIADVNSTHPILPGKIQITAFWLRYEVYEDVLLALGALCQRDTHSSPSTYKLIPNSAAQLVSHIYEHLSHHITNSSPTITRSVMAFIFTATCKPHFDDLSASVGLLPSPGIERLPQSAGGLRGDAEDDANATFYDDAPPDAGPLPSFIPSILAEALPRAQRSLLLLHAASPNHPILRSRTHRRYIHWSWSNHDVNDVWHGRIPRPPPRFAGPYGSGVSNTSYQPELDGFKIFDLEPNVLPPRHILSDAQSHNSLHAFISSFPDNLPSLTPTLSDVVDLALEPLISHTAILSGAVVAVYLSPQTHLHFYTHLTVLRSYLLLTSDSFKARLQAAIFSNAPGPPRPTSSSAFRRRSISHSRVPQSEGKSTWVIGLAPGLTENQIWPPGGSDLGFYLRTVIVDTLPLSSVETRAIDGDGVSQIWRAAESRLGFALRELPILTGREKWLNPLALEALDFLYMDYKPPSPLNVLISRSIISRYQRLFSFMLRIMRVDQVMQAVYRMTRDVQVSLFPTLSKSNALLLYFRFVVQRFITSLSSYVADNVIRGHFDHFMDSVFSASQEIVCDTSSTTDNLHNGHRSNPSKYTDVFILAQKHSDVLDEMLSSCLLRSGQKTAGDKLQGVLELILDFGILAGDLYQGRLEEYQAATTLENLWNSFRLRTKSLIVALSDLAGNAGPTLIQFQDQDSRQPLDTRESLQDLLMRLDMSEWWRKPKESKPSRTTS